MIMNTDKPEPLSDSPGFFHFLSRLWGFLRPYRMSSLIVLLCLSIEVFFMEAMLPLGFQKLIDDVLLSKDAEMLVIVLGVLFTGGLLYAITTVWKDRLMAVLVNSVLNDL